MIGTLLKLIFSKWLSIKRWNNFPRIEDITPLDNTWFVIHISLFLAEIEEKNWKKIDKEYIIKKILFDLFKALILSDINSWTRDYIIKEDEVIMQELEDKVLKYILSLDWEDFLIADIKAIFSKEDKNIEDDIISSAKKFAWYHECLVNSRVFLFTYDVAMEQIQEYLENNKKKLYSLWVLLENDNYKKYLWHIRRLSHAERWSWKQRNYPISVMSHLTIITFISYLLASIENNSWEDYDVLEIMLKSIYHDIPEAITGDIITPTKNAVKWFREVLEKVEENMMEDYFFVYIDDDYKDKVSKYMLDPFSWKHWDLAKKADIFSALFEAKIERDGWNTEFDIIYKNIKKQVNTFSWISSDYFLKNVIMNFEEDISDIDLTKV